MIFTRISIFIFSVLVASAITSLADARQILRYERPAQDWMTEALPVGNGDLGAMIFGGTEWERLQFNEKSLWTGSERDTGAYQAFGDVFVQFSGLGEVTEYLRELDLERAVQTTSYLRDGVRYRREVIASHPAGAIIVRMTADKPGSFSGRVWLSDRHGADVVAGERRLTATGVLNNGLDYESQLLLVPQGGVIKPELAEGFKNEPRIFAQSGPAILDGKADAYLSLGNSDSPVYGYGRANDDADCAGLPLQIGSEWFDRGISFVGPGNINFETGRKYQWATFHAQVRGDAALQVWADGTLVKETAALNEKSGPLYVSVPLHGARSMKIVAVSQGKPAAGNNEILLGHLRISPASEEPKVDPGVVRVQSKECPPGWKYGLPPAALVFERCDSLTLILSARTSYLPQAEKNWRGPHPHEEITAAIDRAARASWSDLFMAHEKDYRSLFGRLALNLGATDGKIAALPTNQRLISLAAGHKDPELEALFFQYGRYLMISSSRAGGLPANLQGVWNDSNNPPWRCDYHTDVNVQMNYWPADVANLSECFAPLADWISASLPIWVPSTKQKFDVPGWTTRGENGIFGGSSWEWVPASNAWLCQNLWSHYEFTENRVYLERVYPILKQACEYWMPRLIKLPNGSFITPVDFSPEHGPHEEGISFVQQLVWDLFTNYLAAAKVLEKDGDYQSVIADRRGNLLRPQIGKWGQLQEWMTDRDDQNEKHRHTSHLIAIYPSGQISPRETPALARAARISLDARGDESTGWALAWRVCLWARLLDGDRAYKLLRNQLRPVTLSRIEYTKGGGTYSNLLDAHPPFQIDGNFGAVAGICEMLLQSHRGEIDLLPALPEAWPKGEIKGLKARGGLTVDIAWKDGRLIAVEISGPQKSRGRLRYREKVIDFVYAPGAHLRFGQNLEPL